MKKTKIIILLLPVLLNACMKVKNKNSDAPSPSAENPIKQLSAEQELPYEIIAGESPDAYNYRFSLNLPQVRLFVNRVTSDGSAVEMIQTNAQGEWLEQKIPASTETNYQFGSFQNNEFKAIKTITIKKPKDLVISGTTRWSQIKSHFVEDSSKHLQLEKFHRLYLSEGSILITEGENLNLVIKELFAKNAQLQTWPDGQTAAPGQNGRPGGQIFIQAEKVYGKLLVKLHGENGGPGLPGKADPSLNGAQGMPGAPHQFTGRTDTSNCYVQGLCPTLYSCEKAATSGSPGDPGRKGFKGGTGFRGGNSGFILFKISLASELVWNLDIIPGIGGEGGAGGPGGEGGNGGPAGEWQVPSPYDERKKIPGPCPKPLDSLKGHPGEFGDKGDTGASGIKEVSCLTEGTKPPLCL